MPFISNHVVIVLFQASLGFILAFRANIFVAMLDTVLMAWTIAMGFAQEQALHWFTFGGLTITEESDIGP